MKIGGRLHAVVHALALELLDALERETPRLKGADARRDDHRPRRELRARARCHVELSARQGLELGDLLAQVELGMEGLHLLQQTVYQLLRTAHRQRRNVVDRLVRIQLGALTPDLGQRVDDDRADAEKSEFKDLEDAHGTGADDGRFHVVGGASGRLGGDGRLDSIRHDVRANLEVLEKGRKL